jgi:hypothetical protein
MDLILNEIYVNFFTMPSVREITLGKGRHVEFLSTHVGIYLHGKRMDIKIGYFSGAYFPPSAAKIVTQVTFLAIFNVCA